MATTRKKKNSSRVFLFIGAIIILIFIVIMALGKEDEIMVLTELSEKRTIVSSVAESGSVEPKIEVKIAPDVSGEIVELNVKEGDQVKKGQLLMVIRPDNYRSLLDQAQASLNSATANHLQAKAALAQARATFLQDSANFTRNNTLFRENAVSKVELENAKLKRDISYSQLESATQSVRAAYFQMESGRASLKQARQNLDRTTILASMDGTITRLNVELGERVVGTSQMAGTELLRIANLSKMQVKVDINENDIIHLRIGDSADVEIDAWQDKVFKGRVAEISYSASSDDPMSMASSDQITLFGVTVEINPGSYVNDPEIMRGIPASQSPFRPGMSAQVEIFTEKVEDVVSVSTQAVTIKRGLETDREDAQEVVYVLGPDNKVVTKNVEIGLSDDKYIEVTKGLSAGEKIITGPPAILYKTLRDGLVVKELPQRDKDGKISTKPAPETAK